MLSTMYPTGFGENVQRQNARKLYLAIQTISSWPRSRLQQAGRISSRYSVHCAKGEGEWQW